MRTFSSSYFKWKQNKGTVSLGSLSLNRFPTEGFYIRSAKTKAKLLFLPNNETAENLDGEAYDFFNPGGNVEVRVYAG